MPETAMTTNEIVAREEHQLALLERAKEALAEAKSIEDVLEVRDRASALKAYAEKKKLGEAAVRLAKELLLRAHRRLGEFTRAMEKAAPKAGPGRGRRTVSGRGQGVSKSATLADAGIKRQDASCFEAIAAIPGERFEAEVARPEATTQGLARIGREYGSKRAGPTRGPAPRPSRADAPNWAFHRRAQMFQGRVDQLVRNVFEKWPAETMTPLLTRILRQAADDLEERARGKSLA